MALIDDINSAKELWKNGSSLTRGFILVSTFFASGTIASLADTVFAWKGFILDGMNFYKGWVLSPIQEVANYFSLTVNENEANFLILTALFMSAVYRKVWVTSEVGMKIFSGASMFSTILLLVYLNGTSDGQANNVIYYVYLILLLIYPVMRKFNNEEKVAYYLPIISAIVLTLVAGAVNAGISKQIVMT